jgi:acyl-coenzyme A synthetase/AMP-(fatty) acid ligase
MTSQTERMKRELWSDLMTMVEAGELTDVQAMEWYNSKCDQWEAR